MSSNPTGNDATRIRNLLKKSKNKQLSFSEITEIFRGQNDDSHWSHARIKRAFDYMIKNPKKGAYVTMVPGGRGIRIRTSERTAKGTGWYRDIINVIEGHADGIAKIFNPDNTTPVRLVFDVHAGRTGHGGWSRPDIIVFAKTKETLTRPKAIHALEFETYGKASPSNVAQAWASGQGADYSWLLFDHRDRPTTARGRIENHEWMATERIAAELGVGLISYRSLRLASTWRVQIPARKMRRDSKARATLIELTNS